MSLASIEHGLMQALVQYPTADDPFLSSLSSVGTLTPEIQLSIYRSNLNGAHQKVLAQVYPACLNIVGEDYFNQLCRHYRFQNPSIHTDLNHYGDYFSDFLHKQIQLRPELAIYTYLPDLAMLEWQWHTSHFAKDDNEFCFTQLGKLSVVQQQRISFEFSNSFSIHCSIYPIIGLWQGNREMPASEQNFVMPETSTCYCIYRDHYISKIEVLNTKQHALLESIARQHDLQELNEAFGPSVQEHLVYFIQKGWIQSFQLRK